MHYVIIHLLPVEIAKEGQVKSRLLSFVATLPLEDERTVGHERAELTRLEDESKQLFDEIEEEDVLQVHMGKWDGWLKHSHENTILV